MVAFCCFDFGEYNNCWDNILLSNQFGKKFLRSIEKELLKHERGYFSMTTKSQGTFLVIITLLIVTLAIGINPVMGNDGGTPEIQGDSSDIVLDDLSATSPNGEFTAIVTASNLGMDNSQLWLITNQDSEKTLIDNGDTETWLTNPIWSPGGLFLAYIKVVTIPLSQFESDSRYEIWVFDNETSQSYLVSDSLLINPSIGYMGISNIEWENDTEILFQNNKDFPIPYYALNVTNSAISGPLGYVETPPRLKNEQPGQVPYFSQCNSNWATLPLGTCSVTICKSGCAITSVSMVFNYYGETFTPKTLNSWLTNNGGYNSGCYINWSKSATATKNVIWKARIDKENFTLLKSELDQGYPVIVEVKRNDKQHFVVVTGYNGNTYYINDPASVNNKTLASYNNHFVGLRIFELNPIPAKPSGVNASDETYMDRIRVNWNLSSRATYYEVYRNATNSSIDATLLSSPSISPFDDTSAIPGTTYYYFVKACNTYGCSPFSLSDSGQLWNLIPKLVAPVGVITAKTPTYKWGVIKGATKYEFRVYKGISTSPLLVKSVDSSACGTEYCTNTPSTPLLLDSYKWQARAYVGGAWKSWSVKKSFTLMATGFNSQFTSDANGWTPVKGSWNVGDGYYKTSTLVSNGFASAKHANTYGVLTYTVKIKATGCNNCAHGLMFNGTPSPASSNGKWYSGYGFFINNAGRYSIWKYTNGIETSLVPWDSHSAITSGWNVIKVTYNKNSRLTQFFVNGTMLPFWGYFGYTSGQVGLIFARDSTASTFYVDYATLTTSAPKYIKANSGVIIFDEPAKTLDGVDTRSE